MTISSIKNALWPSTALPNTYQQANTGNLVVNANDLSSIAADHIYDAVRNAYINKKTGMITTTSDLASTVYSASQTDPLGSSAQRLKLLSLRLRITEGTFPKSFTDLHTSRDGDTVFVFVTLKGKAVTLEDNAGLFPSDTLVSQIRLLMD